MTRRHETALALGACSLFALGCRPHDATAPADASPSPEASTDVRATKGGARRVFIANHGKLVGAMSGFAWVAGGDGTAFEAPSPCNEAGCFTGAGNTLCTRGTIAAFRCTAGDASCNWETNWGAKIGLDVGRPGERWGGAAPLAISIEYTGAPTTMRLTVHRTGDPPSKDYCVDRYASGATVGAGSFSAHCWDDSGERLSDFESVDKIGLQVPSTHDSVPFNYCIEAIWTQPRTPR